MEKTVEIEVIEAILQLYGFREKAKEQKMYIHSTEDNGWMELIFRITLEKCARKKERLRCSQSPAEADAVGYG